MCPTGDLDLALELVMARRTPRRHQEVDPMRTTRLGIAGVAVALALGVGAPAWATPSTPRHHAAATTYIPEMAAPHGR